MSGIGIVTTLIESLFAQYPKRVEQAKQNPALIGWFVGQIMKQTGGAFDQGTIEAMIKLKL